MPYHVRPHPCLLLSQLRDTGEPRVPMTVWAPGDRLTHRDNPGLGAGRVAAIEGRTLVVDFPGDGTRLRIAAASEALQPLQLPPGRRVRFEASGEEAVIAEVLPGGRVKLHDGRSVAADQLWPVDLDEALVERLALGDVDPLADFANRLDALHLATLREAAGLGSFLGGRIRLFPHQLHAAERATAADPVRWLLADEVGLGKTVEACLILNHLLRKGRAERCLVVAPATLVVQWLGELWRKYHQVFVLLDEERLDDVARDFGAGFNPFDVHRRAVVALETLVERPELSRFAVQAGIDLLVVDEAHRLRRPRGHEGDPAWRAIEPIAAGGRHLLLLTATPLEDDAHGFFRLLQLLRPAEFPDDDEIDARLASGKPLPPCTSSTRRADVGGLPPRQAAPVTLPAGAWTQRLALEEALRSAPINSDAAIERKLKRLRRAGSSGAALSAVLGAGEKGLRRLADEADATDPRLIWLIAQSRRWRAAGEKTLVFVAHRETLDLVRDALSHRAQLASAAFHEELTPAQRDIEVAQFRLGVRTDPDTASNSGPSRAHRGQFKSVLVSTECGGEGRNFEFCHRLVLFDLPWNPVAVEQRIGRLDRIGRTLPVEIVYFQEEDGIGGDVVRTYESLGLFDEALAGLEPELASVEAALQAASLLPPGTLEPGRLEDAIRQAHGARTRIRDAAYAELHRDRYRPELADAILARVPEQLDELNEEVVTAGCELLGLSVEGHLGQRRYSIDFANEARVDSLPGVPGGASFLGTFDREEAVADEALDFFAAGHPLVEGVLGHLQESPRGRVAVLHMALPGAERGSIGLLALYDDGPGLAAVALDAAGNARADWVELLTRRPLKSRRLAEDVMADPEWADTIHALAAHLDHSRQPVALAAVVAAG